MACAVVIQRYFVNHHEVDEHAVAQRVDDGGDLHDVGLLRPGLPCGDCADARHDVVDGDDVDDALGHAGSASSNPQA
jgi:hypothetical protein